MRNKQYCIFNKQYSKEEYEGLVAKIITHMQSTGEWGEFFPSALSPYGYNQTLANEAFPLSKSEAIAQGFHWTDYEAPFPKVEKIIPADKLPKNIEDVPDDILNWAIECELTKKPFKIIAQELVFYRKHGISVPRRHPDQRHLDRAALRNPRKLFERNCDKCEVLMQTSYHPESPETVYCEACYSAEVY